MEFSPESPNQKERVVADYHAGEDGHLSAKEVLKNFEDDDTIPEWARRKIGAHLRFKHTGPGSENSFGRLSGFKVTEKGDGYEVEIKTIAYTGSRHVERTDSETFRKEDSK